ncbi:hypothetical protein AUC61_12635 [Pseudomonas sp. S25]|uniref:O-antigen ligase-related domain-containing protein n=2 Tax=Pseudomonas maioricensis TaxID=1766623 RepID=A0ABS9ZII2_9PSED|nr:hypothetical protein [Pseudomonas sp. S25]
MLFYGRQPIPLRIQLLITLAMLSAALSSYLGLSGYYIGERQIAGSILFYGFFVFGSLVPDLQRFFKGLFAGICVVATLVMLVFFIERPYQVGLIMFSVADYRLWGANYFPDWPNYLAFMLGLGFLLGIFVERRFVLAAVCLIAAFMTTSRTPLFALGFALIFILFKMGWRARIISFLAGLVFLIISAVVLLPTADMGAEFFVRLFLFSDRAEVYSSAWRLFEVSPYLGSGAVLLDERVGNHGAASFHNTYLDILVRQGFLGLIIFLALVFPNIRRARPEHVWMMGAIIMYFLVPSMFQNFLKHPHFVMIYSAILATLVRRKDL